MSRRIDMNQSNRKPLNILVIVLSLVLVALVAFALFSLDIFGTRNSRAQNAVANDARSLDIGAMSDNLFDANAASEDIVMALGGSKDTYVLKGEEYIDGGCQVQDTSDHSLSFDVVTSGNVDTNTVGDYEITYMATLPDGRFNTATRTVHVVESFEDGTASSVPVLMYHYVYTEDDPPDNVDANHLLDTKLAAQLEYMNDHGYYYPSFQELRAFIDGDHSLPAKSVILTFDDAEERFLKYGMPVLNEYQVPATSFVICSDDDASYKTTAVANPYVQFQSHSYDMHHGGGGKGQGGILHAMSYDQLLDDANEVKDILGDYTAMAYPFGDNSETAWQALEDVGALCAFTVKYGQVHPGDNPYALNRVRVSGGNSLEGFIGSLG